MEDKKQRYVNVLLDQDLLDRIDNVRFEQRFESRTETIRWLLQAAIDKKLRPPKKPAVPKEMT